MKKTILLAALGLISLSALAQDKPQEEGFVFTTVKTRLHPLRIRTVRALAGASQASVFSNRNCSAQERVNTIFLKCSLYTTRWLTELLTTFAIMATVLSLREEVSMISCSV